MQGVLKIIVIDFVGKKKGKGREFTMRTKKIKGESEKMSVAERKFTYSFFFLFIKCLLCNHVLVTADTERVTMTHMSVPGNAR